MLAHSFFAYIFRMRYITRWALMRNTRTENVEEHSYEVAVLAHALAAIGQEIFHQAVDPASGRRCWRCSTTRRKSSPAICPPPSSTTTQG